MKKTLFIAATCIACLLPFNSVFAQTASSSAGFIVATVDINNTKIVSENGRNFVLSFTLANESGAQPQIQYAVKLTNASGNSPIIYDEHVYNEMLSIGQNEHVNETINYSIPDALPAGTYQLWIEVKNESGLPLGSAYAGKAIITDNVSNTVEIIPNSCSFNNQTFIATCSINSSFQTTVTFVPTFVTKQYSIFGTVIPQTGGGNSNITIQTGSSTISVSVPKAENSGNDNVTFSLVSADGSTTSNEVNFMYTLGTELGIIRNVIFDKTFYKAGDTANVQIFSNQNVASTLTLSVVDSFGNSCASPVNVTATNAAVTKLQVPIIKDCVNPTANVTLFTVSATGAKTILDSNNFKINSPQNIVAQEAAQASSATNTIIIIVIVIIILIILLSVAFRKKKNQTIVVIIAGLFIFGLAHSAKALTIDYPINDSSGWQGSIDFTLSGVPTTVSPESGIAVGVDAYINQGPFSLDQLNFSVNGNVLHMIAGAGSCQFPSVGQSGQSVSFFAPSTVGAATLNLSYYISDIYDCGKGGEKISVSQTFNNPVTYDVVTPPTFTSPAPGFTISQGASTTLSWTSGGYNYCSIAQEPQDGSASSTIVVGSPIVPPIYQFTGFNNPSGVAYDSLGNIFVVDTGNNVVYKFDASGNKTTIGNGQLNSPTGIAVDSSNDLYVSDSGNNRIEKFTLSGDTYTSSVFGNANGEFVSVDSNSDVATSPNGTTWTVKSKALGSSNTWNSVTYGNGTFVAVDSNSDVATSPNGTTWTVKSKALGSSNTWNSVTYGNGTFVAVDSNSDVATSPNGTTWTVKSKALGSSNTWNSVTYGNGTFVAVDSNSDVATSPNGTTWTVKSKALGSSNTWNSVTYGNGTFVAVDSNSDVATSPNGTTWTVGTGAISGGSNNVWNSVTYGNGTFVAVNSGSSVATSSNGSNWAKEIGTLLVSGNSRVWNSVTYGNGTFVAVDSNSDVATSPNGTTWTVESTAFGTSESWNSVTYGNGIIPFPFNNPTGISIDSSGNVYIADTGNNVIEKFNSSGNYISSISGYSITTTSHGHQTTTGYTFNNPTGVAVNSSDAVYVADAGNDLIEKLDSSGNYISETSIPGNTKYGATASSEIAIDSSGNVYVATNVSGGFVTEFNSSLSEQLAQLSASAYYPGIAVNSNDAVSGGEAVYIEKQGTGLVKYNSSLNTALNLVPQTGNPEFSGATSTLPINANTNFVLSCTDMFGNIATSSLLINLSGAPTADIEVSSSTITSQNPGGTTTAVNAGDPVYLSYSGSGLSSYTVSSNPDIVAVSSKGSNNVATVLDSETGIAPFGNTKVVNITQKTTFTIQGTGTNGSPVIKTATAYIKPIAPSGLSATSSCGGVSLSWTPVSGEGITYNIYRTDTAGSIASTVNTYYTDTTAANASEKYTYYVTAVEDSVAESNPSGTVSATIPAYCNQPPATSGATSCSASQVNSTNPTGTPGGIIYVNQQMTWTMNNIDPSTVIGTIWSGTGLPLSGINTSGISLSNIYTTVGPKTINATTTYGTNGSIYTATCSTTVRLAPGTNQEI